MLVSDGGAFLVPEKAASGQPETERHSGIQDTSPPGCTPDAPADASQIRPDPSADAPADVPGVTGEEWADMFRVPEGFTLREYPPLSEERISELALMFSAARDKTA